MKEGSYEIHLTEPTQIDSKGFQARRKGLEVRDCLLILVPGPKTRLGLLTRSEMSCGVVEAQVRGKGKGVLDIDASRIFTNEDTSRPSGGANDRKCYGKFAHDDGDSRINGGHDRGRFPANLLLLHGPSCVCEGTKKVKNTSGSVSGLEPSAVTKNAYGEYQGRKPYTAFGDAEGNEEVANWICEPSCPVSVLDRQSGTLKSGSVEEHHMRNGKKGIFEDGLKPMSLMGYGDSGGASRFFYQSKTKYDLNTYLARLVRGSINEDYNE